MSKGTLILELNRKIRCHGFAIGSAALEAKLCFNTVFIVFNKKFIKGRKINFISPKPSRRFPVPTLSDSGSEAFSDTEIKNFGGPI